LGDRERGNKVRVTLFSCKAHRFVHILIDDWGEGGA